MAALTDVHPKVAGSALAGAITGIIIAEAGRHGYPITGDEGANITVLFSAIAGWLIPSATPASGANP